MLLTCKFNRMWRQTKVQGPCYDSTNLFWLIGFKVIDLGFMPALRKRVIVAFLRHALNLVIVDYKLSIDEQLGSIITRQEELVCARARRI